MAGVTEFLEEEGYEQFKKTIHLSKEASKNDPEDEPYKSLYEAREILSNLRVKICDFLNENPQNKDLFLATACLDLHLGCNYADTDETSTGEECLSKVLKSLEDMKLDERAVCIYLHALNHLGVVWCSRNRYDKAKDYLDQAEQLFHQFKRDIGDTPKQADEFFTKPDGDEQERYRKRMRKFESILTHTLYYKAQVLAKVGEDKLSAQYCHTTLRRQLDSHDYDPTDWALNAATLSQVSIQLSFNFVLYHFCHLGSTPFGTCVTNCEAMHASNSIEATQA
jgi:tetratricopeptide (TPR) repeat protein